MRGARARLDPAFAEHRVVGVPAEDLVGEDVEVLVDAEAPLGEELVERDTVRPVRLAREQVSLHRRASRRDASPFVGETMWS